MFHHMEKLPRQPERAGPTTVIARRSLLAERPEPVGLRRLSPFRSQLPVLFVFR
jgi:hypothetical protein